MFYKTASDTINYVSWRCSDVDSTATTVVFLPLIHLSSSSSHPFSPPSPSPSLPLCHCALNPVLSQWLCQSHALKLAAERGKVCVCVIVFCERGRGRKLSCTVHRTASSAVNDAASKRRQTNRQDTTLVA